MTREEALQELRGFIGQLTEGCQEAIKVLIPELKESEDERIKRAIKKALQVKCCDYTFGLGHRIISDESVTLEEAIAWLEKQGEQKLIEWSEEDEENLNMVLDMVKYCSVVPPEDVPSSTGHLRPSEKYKKELMDWLKSLSPQLHKETYQAVKHDLATEFMNYLDNNKPEGKMCLSNGECEDIDKAFKENDWAKIIRYAEKYQIQSEKKPEIKLTGWVARDKNGEIYVYGDYPEKDSERPIWIGSNSINLYQEYFPNLKWEDEPVEVEVTITHKPS